jgi:hypothetical protein
MMSRNSAEDKPANRRQNKKEFRSQHDLSVCSFEIGKKKKRKRSDSLNKFIADRSFKMSDKSIDSENTESKKKKKKKRKKRRKSDAETPNSSNNEIHASEVSIDETASYYSFTVDSDDHCESPKEA